MNFLKSDHMTTPTWTAVYVGIGNEISYEEGKLFIEIPDELDMEGKGLSPKVDVLLKDNGDSFGIDTMSLIDVGVTKSP